MVRFGLALTVVAFGAACGDNQHLAPDAAPMPDAGLADAMPDGNPLEPDTLFGTGLCLDKACMQINAQVSPYTPRFALWADAASKRRWIYLPTGSQIDTSDMDHWKFPQGTKLWMEFTAPDAYGNPVRVETRYIVKVGPGDTVDDWFYVAYQWNPTEDDTIAVPDGVTDANGTQHDIPSRTQCKGCHENLQPTRVLGFGAIQLDEASPPSAGDLDLDGLVAVRWLSVNPPGASSPHYPLPTDANDTYATDALGYLHANCGHCHNPTSQVYTNIAITMVLRLEVGSLASVQATPTYTTTINQPVSANANGGPTTIVTPMQPDDSALIFRFESTNAAIHMPALGSKVTDPTGDTLLRNWITHLP